jgi:hypothetical protein
LVHRCARAASRTFSDDEVDAIHRATLAADRWQYIASGALDTRFGILEPMLTAAQGAASKAALAPIAGGSVK